MKKIFEKINSSKILFTITILIIFLLFMFITNGFGGILGEWYGLLVPLYYLFDTMFNFTFFGSSVVVEIFYVLLLIPIILIFKNKYIFTQKRKGFIKSTWLAWPVIIFALLLLISGISNVGLSNINIYEVIALLSYTFLIGLFEELMCRGWLQNEFIERFGNNRKNVLFSIFISGFFFGVIHIINFFGGQSLVETLAQILGATIAGFTFGALYYKTKNIWAVVFLHALWDFAVFFPEITTATTCVTNISGIESVSVIMGLFYLFAILFQEIPEVATGVMLLGKTDINEGLSKEKQVKYSEEEIKESKHFKKVITIIMIIFLSLYAVVTAISIFTTKSSSGDVCPTYVKKEVNEFSEEYVYYKLYDLDIKLEKETCILNNNIETTNEQLNGSNLNDTNICKNEILNYQLHFKINDNDKLEISNNNSQTIILDYENVESLAIIQNNDKYDVIISVYADNMNGDVVIYRSNYIDLNTFNNDIEYLNGLKDSFSQVLLPSIERYGIYNEKGNDYNYPLFVSQTEDRYILYPDGTIYTYSNK